MKKIKTIKDFLHSYYEKNLDRLQKDYPGLPFKRFLDEYCEFDNSEASSDFFMENPAFFEKIRLGVPLEYINFKSYFYTNEFYVNQDVLIPRSETEILVEKAIGHINKNYHDQFNICDIGTGSGAIALTIATEVQKPINISATDISKDALDVAQINFENLREKMHPETKIKFQIRDRLTDLNEKFDLIVSNPPYIKTTADREGVHKQVHGYEPHIALYLKDEEYDLWFETLFQQVSNCLNHSGIFMMEGHETNLKELAKTAQSYFKKVVTVQDYTQRDRFLVCNL